MKIFKYKSFNRNLDELDLNLLGSKGWELVSHTALIDNGRMNNYYVFKREIF